jgi:hypothetical protein
MSGGGCEICRLDRAVKHRTRYRDVATNIQLDLLAPWWAKCIALVALASGVTVEQARDAGS